MIARAAALSLLAGLAASAAVAGPAARADGPARAGAARPDPGVQAPLVVTMPDTQPALPSGMIEMDPSRTPSLGDANALEPNIDHGGARVR